LTAISWNVSAKKVAVWRTHDVKGGTERDYGISICFNWNAVTLPRYRVFILPIARNDIQNTYRYIADELLVPEIADKYTDGIYTTIGRLSLHGGMIAVSTNENLLRLYGPEVRTTRYKKMTIIYTLAGDVAIVCRVVAGSLIV
jgi:plasmid stabilization system protein ParE